MSIKSPIFQPFAEMARFFLAQAISFLGRGTLYLPHKGGA